MFTSSPLRARALLALVLSITTGCGAAEAAIADEHARARLSIVMGQVSVDGGDGAPSVVAILRPPEREGAPLQIVDFVQVFGADAPYELVVQPGTYRLLVFEDANRDLAYTPGERLTPFDDFRDLELAPGLRSGVDLRIAGPPPSVDEVMPAVADPTWETRSFHVGDVLPLEDARFGADAARTGVWEPLRFLEELGAGLFMLEPYDPARTPVVFVHGFGGHPQEFTDMIGRLDRARFQPWVAHYPSGWELELTAQYFNRALNELETLHHFERLCVVAHSMGGVVSRRMLAVHAAQRESAQRSFVRVFVTLASPLGGHPGAAHGVVLSPIVVGSWRSLVPGDPFIRDLYAVPLPEETYYALFFAHLNDEASDGVVPLPSQLRGEAQDEADLLRGFIDTHTGVLRSERVWERLSPLLDRCRDLP